jgi:cytochrome P450
MLPWNPVLGHIIPVFQLMRTLPKDAQKTLCFGQLARQFSESDNMYYLDLWPFLPPMLIVTCPAIAQQVCHKYDLPKSEALAKFLKPIMGDGSLFVTNDHQHATSRAVFSPGFSANVIFGHIGNVIDQAKVYTKILREHAMKQDLFSLDELTCYT